MNYISVMNGFSDSWFIRKGTFLGLFWFGEDVLELFIELILTSLGKVIDEELGLPTDPHDI